MEHGAAKMSGLRVVVTGAGGFVGTAVLADLARVGAQPIALVRSGRGGRVPQVVADLVTDPLDPILADLSPDAIIHCAGLTAAPETEAGQAAMFAANLTGTARLIAAAARLPRPVRVVVVSSAAIWGPMADGISAIEEAHPMRPVSAYGVSKAAATLHALAEGRRLGLDLAVAVPFNVLGPGQPDRLVPQLFLRRLCAEPGSLALLNGGAVRDWLDVGDVARALVALAGPNGPRGLFNLASGQGHSVAQVLGLLCRIGGWNPVILGGRAQDTSGVGISIGNPGRLMAATGWRPRITLDQSLRRMVFAATMPPGGGPLWRCERGHSDADSGAKSESSDTKSAPYHGAGPKRISCVGKVPLTHSGELGSRSRPALPPQR